MPKLVTGKKKYRVDLQSGRRNSRRDDDRLEKGFI